VAHSSKICLKHRFYVKHQLEIELDDIDICIITYRYAFLPFSAKIKV